ncbi:MAG: prephenate dehydrogenase/arogenate dehydrogenase family protein [Planctomycetota bacterium]
MSTDTHDPAPFPESVAVLALGLLGGSVLKAISKRFPKSRRIGWARSSAVREIALDQAIANVVVDRPEDAVAQAEVVVVASPVNTIAELARDSFDANPNAIFTDVGSTKKRIVTEVERHPGLSQRFVAAHPIAGSEKGGIEFADADLFQDRTVVVTPSGRETAGHVEKVEAFWMGLGAQVVRTSPTEHDRLLALTSHLPHLLAALASRQVDAAALAFVGTGWRDTTRVAAGNADLWASIVSENREYVLQALDGAIGDLQRLADRVRGGDDAAVRDWLDEGRDRRLQSDGESRA